MKIEYDKDLDVMYVRFRSDKYAFSEEINENTIIDFDVNGRILAIEILDISKILGQKLLEKTLVAEAATLT